jgi:hypothetical protein
MRTTPGTEGAQAMVERLGKRATLKLFQDADNSLHLPVTGRTDAKVRAEMLETLASWLQNVL